MTILFDTGPFVAAADRSDKHHAACAELLQRLLDSPDPLLVPAPVMVEVCWLLAKFRGPEAEARFLDLIATDEIELVETTAEDASRMADLVRQYADFPLGCVDAAVIAAAERLAITQIATIDHRHFTAVRPRHIEAFTLLP